MNGAHDLGGRMGFGPIMMESDEPVFHEDWEARMFALAVATGGIGTWTLDEDRHACENRTPQEYLRLSYYNIWLEAFSRLLVDKVMATSSELKNGRACKTAAPHKEVLRPEHVTAAMTAPGSYVRDVASPPRFSIGEPVRARNCNPVGHTRLPRYLRGHAGKIAAIHGAHVFPDSNAHGKGEDPQWLYTVRFTAREVWGRDTRDAIHAELWEPYLEPI